ncbi:MAG: tRNA pseudouridine(38-40) synthase TruA [candidate division WOR-3 bacterium]
MRNFKLTIEYEGTDFFGWQYQPNKRTVQGEIESALKRITKENIRVIGAGRTDQGVHALGQVANFKTESEIKPENLKDALNSLIADDVYIKEIIEVPLDFNARSSAKSKIYQYNIMRKYSPLQRRYFWLVEYTLNLGEMKRAIRYFIGEHDFKNLSVSDRSENKLSQIDGNNRKSTLCMIYNISITEAGSQLMINIEGNRFLRKMVRGIVGVLIDIGRGRFKSEDVYEIYEGKIKNLYFAPPHGLYLVEVRY